jgi:hypothetical protein
VSTPDLLKLIPEASWQPNLVPIDDPLYLPEEPQASDSITIGQSATQKDLKNTDDLASAVSDINQKGIYQRVILNIIENTDHRECLKRKNMCHIIFDHMQGYFGVSSLESLSQGKPVIAGLDNWNVRHIKDYTGADWVPWLVCRHKRELKERLISLLSEPEETDERGQRSREFMCQYWSDVRIASTLVGFYESL